MTGLGKAVCGVVAALAVLTVGCILGAIWTSGAPLSDRLGFTGALCFGLGFAVVALVGILDPNGEAVFDDAA